MQATVVTGMSGFPESPVDLRHMDIKVKRKVGFHMTTEESKRFITNIYTLLIIEKPIIKINQDRWTIHL